MTLQPMLKPGEIRKAPSTTPGWTVEVGCVAGGSFTQVMVRDSLGVRAWNRSYVLQSEALDKFAELSA